MYKVFIQDKPIFFIQNNDFSHYNGIFIPENLGKNHHAYFADLAKNLPEGLSVYVLCEDPARTVETFFSDHVLEEAAGGIVKRKNKYLFIKRNGLWDLPKGKMDEGETPEITARREIEEECGIVAPVVKDLILITYHTFSFRGRPTLKKTYWYELTYDGPKEVSPQLEEGITKVSWKKSDKLDKALANTYNSIRDVVHTYFAAKTTDSKS